MSNCLVIGLPASVNAANLPILGTIVVEKPATDVKKTINFTPKNGATISVKVVSGQGKIGNNATEELTELTITGNGSQKSFYCSTDAMTLHISQKYDILKFGDTGATMTGVPIVFNLDDFSGCTDMQVIRLSNVSSVPNGKGSIKSLHGLSNLTYLGLRGYTNIEGNVNDFGSLTSLVEIDLTGFNITIEDFVAVQIAGGRDSVSSSSPINFWYTPVWFGGTKMPASLSLIWESASKITMFNEGSLESATIIYAKGATSEEISAWQQAGKTVNVIQ